MHRTVCDFALDLVQNSIEASSALIVLDVEESEKEITFYLSDNGVGMDEAELEAAQDPFFTNGTKHSKRDVGLGIPFLVQAVEMAGGTFDISSEKGQGTSATFTFRKDNIDTPPIGDLSETFLAALTYPGDFELVIHRLYTASEENDFSYSLERSSLRDAVGNFEEVGALSLLRKYVRSMEEYSEERVSSES